MESVTYSASDLIRPHCATASRLPARDAQAQVQMATEANDGDDD
jgi:hypothetical protein